MEKKNFVLEYFGASYEIKSKLFSILIGNFLFSLSINLFFIPHSLLSGGIGGVSVMLQYITGFPAGLSIFLLNMPLFFFGLKILNKKFLVYAFISTIVLSVEMSLLNGVHNYFMVDDIFLSSIFGGLLAGSGMGILFKNGACQGGMDIVAAVAKKKYNMNIGSTLMTINALIIAFASYLFGIEKGMYTIIALFISYTILDRIQMGFGEMKSILVISKYPDEIAKEINNQLSRGVTFLKGEGAWSKEDVKIIYCIVRNIEIASIKNIILEIDPTAFVGIQDMNEVKGRGFKTKEL